MTKLFIAYRTRSGWVWTVPTIRSRSCLISFRSSCASSFRATRQPRVDQPVAAAVGSFESIHARASSCPRAGDALVSKDSRVRLASEGFELREDVLRGRGGGGGGHRRHP